MDIVSIGTVAAHSHHALEAQVDRLDMALGELLFAHVIADIAIVLLPLAGEHDGTDAIDPA